MIPELVFPWNIFCIFHGYMRVPLDVISLSMDSESFIAMFIYLENLDIIFLRKLYIFLKSWEKGKKN